MELMTPIISSFFIYWCLYTSQLLCAAAPIIIEMNHTYPSTGETVETKIKIDDSLMERILLEHVLQNPPSEYKVTDTPEVNDEGFYDYNDLDCAMPVMPALIPEEDQKDQLAVRQIQPSRTHSVMDSIVGGLNGIAMSLAAAGICVYNFFRSSS